MHPTPGKGERMSKKERNCLNCRIHWDREGLCEVCRWEDKDNPSLFYQITRSPEVLAEKFVYSVMLDYCYEEWYSTLFPDKCFSTKSEAIAATVAKLKEVEK
jgi:hypothetical protein